MPAILRLAVVNVVGRSTSVSNSSRRLQPAAFGHSPADALSRLPIMTIAPAIDQSRGILASSLSIKLPNERPDKRVF